MSELPAERDLGRTHRIVWAAIGGGALAVLALVIGLWYSTTRQTTDQSGPLAHNGAHVMPHSAHDSATAGSTVINSADDLLAELDSLRDEGETASSPPSKPLSPTELYKLVAPAVITLEIQNEDETVIGRGSGFLVDPSALRTPDNKKPVLQLDFAGKRYRAAFALTNYHVIENAVDAFAVFDNGARVGVSQVVTESEAHDLALLMIFVERSTALPGLAFVRQPAEVGDTVFAIGSPQGLSGSLSEGIISGIRNLDQSNWIQTSAAISPGSSGGPLVSRNGEVVGVITKSRIGGQNLNFAVPASEARALLSRDYSSRPLWRGTSIIRDNENAFLSLRLYYETEQKHPALKKLLDAWDMMIDGKHSKALEALENLDSDTPHRFLYLLYQARGMAHQSLMLEELPEIGPLSKPEDFNPRPLSPHWRPAVEALEASVEKLPRGPTLHSLACAYQDVRDYQRALAYSEKAVALLPRCADVYYTRALSRKDLNDRRGAREDLEACVRLNPVAGGYWSVLGDAYREADDLEKAIEAYQTALQLKCDHPFASYHGIGVAYQKIGRYEKAIAAFEQAKAEGAPPGWCDRELAECRRRLRQE